MLSSNRFGKQSNRTPKISRTASSDFVSGAWHLATSDATLSQCRSVGTTPAYMHVVEIPTAETWSSVSSKYYERVSNKTPRMRSPRVWAPFPWLLESNRSYGRYWERAGYIKPNHGVQMCNALLHSAPPRAPPSTSESIERSICFGSTRVA